MTQERIAQGRIHTSSETLEAVAKKYLRRNPVNYSPALLDTFAFSERRIDVLLAASHLNTKPSTLDSLADYERNVMTLFWAGHVRNTAILNPHAPKETLIRKASSNDLGLMFNIAIRHYFGYETFEETRDIIARSRSISAKLAVIDDPAVSLATLRYLRDDDPHYVTVSNFAALRIRELFRSGT